MWVVESVGWLGSTRSAEKDGPVQTGPPASPPKHAAPSGAAPNAAIMNQRDGRDVRIGPLLRSGSVANGVQRLLDIPDGIRGARVSAGGGAVGRPCARCGRSTATAARRVPNETPALAARAHQAAPRRLGERGPPAERRVSVLPAPGDDRIVRGCAVRLTRRLEA